MSSLWDKAQEYFYNQEENIKNNNMATTKTLVTCEATDYRVIPIKSINENEFEIHNDAVIIRIIDNDGKELIESEMSADDAIVLANTILKNIPHYKSV
jgi:hypothetical protein